MNIRRITGSGVVLVSGECTIHLSTDHSTLEIVCAISAEDEDTIYAVTNPDKLTELAVPPDGKIRQLIRRIRGER